MQKLPSQIWKIFFRNLHLLYVVKCLVNSFTKTITEYKQAFSQPQSKSPLFSKLLTYLEWSMDFICSILFTQSYFNPSTYIFRYLLFPKKEKSKNNLVLLLAFSWHATPCSLASIHYTTPFQIRFPFSCVVFCFLSLFFKALLVFILILCQILN